MQLHAMSLRTIWSIASRVLIFFFTSERAIKLQFYEYIGAQSSISRKNTLMKVKLCKVFTLENVNKGMRFASGKIKSASLIL